MEEQGHPKENGMDFGAMLPMLMNLLQGSSGEEEATDSSESPPKQEEGSGEGGFDFSAVAGLLGMLHSLNQEDDSVRLLRALKPLLSSGRRERVEQAVKMLRLMNLLPILAESGLLSNFF